MKTQLLKDTNRMIFIMPLVTREKFEKYVTENRVLYNTKFRGTHISKMSNRKNP